MFITFTGNPRCLSDRRDSVTIADVVFPLGVEVEVEASPAFAKLVGNDHFCIREGGGESEIQPDSAAADTKTELIALAAQYGVKIDKRWSADKITKAIDDAALAAQQGV